MKFTCTKENLISVLDMVGGVAGGRTHLPILSHILIDASDAGVRWSATNLEVAVRANLRAKVDASGVFTVPAKTLADFVRFLPDDQVHIERIENELSIQCGATSTKIKGSPPDDFPVIPDAEETHGYAIVHTALKDALAQVVVAVAKNDIRPELSGVYLGFFTERFSGLIAAATDSYRLAEKQLSVAQGADTVQCIVPGRTVLEMIRLLSVVRQDGAESQVRVFVSDNQIALRYDSFELTSRLVDGTYPEYAQIIPSSFKTTAAVARDELVNKIKAASLFTTMGVNAVSFDLNVSEGTVGVSSTSTQTGEHSAEIDAEVSGEENSILLNYRYVLDGLLQMTDGGEVEMKVNSGDTPCLFVQKGDPRYLYIVMPVRQ